MKSTNYKQTEMVKIPKDWGIVNLGDNEFFELVMGQSPPSETYNKDKKGLPFLQGNAEFGHLYPNVTIYCSQPLKRSHEGDILISVRAPVGEVNISNKEYCIGRGVSAIRPKEKANNFFLYYYLIFSKKKVQSVSGGSTFKAITKAQVERIKIPFPQLSEQKAIAGILSTVDNAIQKSNELITKAEKLKKGLIRELLTKGIKHKEFKDVEIGRIPIEWNVLTLNEITGFIKDGTHTPPKRVKTGVPLLSAQNIIDGRIVRLDEDTYITEEEYKKIHNKYEIQKNDVLLTIVGTIGNSAIVDIDYKFSLQRSVAIIRPNSQKIKPWFLHFLLQSELLQRQLLGHTKYTTQGGIYLKELNQLKIPIPSLSEQQKIVEILLSIDEKLILEQKRKEKFETIKKGLMNDLLTGQKRIKIAR
jgi:type I restriction enzyme S subunit